MATVEEVVYYGDMTYYDVLLDGTSAPVRLSMRNVFGRPVLDIGTRTRVGSALIKPTPSPVAVRVLRFVQRLLENSKSSAAP